MEVDIWLLCWGWWQDKTRVVEDVEDKLKMKNTKTIFSSSFSSTWTVFGSNSTHTCKGACIQFHIWCIRFQLHTHVKGLVFSSPFSVFGSSSTHTCKGACIRFPFGVFSSPFTLLSSSKRCILAFLSLIFLLIVS